MTDAAAPGTDAVEEPRPHLLWVNHFAVTPGEGGGTRHFEMSRELVREGWRVTLAASDFTYQQRRYTRRNGEDHGAESQAAVRETLDGVEMVWLWAAAYARNDWRRIWNWLSFGRSLLRWGRSHSAPGARPDIVIGSSPSLFAALAALHLARRWDVPFLLEVRDIWPESLRAVGARRGPGYIGLGLVARYLYRHADRIVVLARGTSDHLESMGVDPSRMAFMPNGVDASAFEGVERPERETFTVAYTGAHGPANGLDVVLDAAEILRDDHPQIRFLFVGDGPVKEQLRADAERRSLHNVVFHDPVAKQELPRVLAGADAGLMVLRDAALFAYGVSPNKLFDYSAAALPIVCNVPGEVAGMVERAGSGEVAGGGSAEALAEAVVRLVERPAEERKAMGEAARRWVVREHDRPVVTARLDALLRALVVP